MYLAGEWISAWLFMSLAFLVAAIGVVGLGWWVLRGDARNRASESLLEPPSSEPENPSGHH